MKLFLAPIQGMTIAFYRNLYAELFGGIDAYYAPFIAINSGRKVKSPIFKDILPQANQEAVTVVPQLLGNNSEDFRFYASTIADMGYKEINWNIGCPFPKVTKKKKGSGILPHPDMINDFLSQVCLDDSYELTVKMRLGLHDVEEGMKVIDILNDYPLKGVILHGRTGDQKYEGTVDLEAFRTLYNACKHDMTYNGDIYTYDDFQKIQSMFPSIHSYMLGRGALSNPYLPSIIKNGGSCTGDGLTTIRRLHDEVFGYYETVMSGDKHLCDRMKEFWVYISKNLHTSEKLYKKLKKSKTKSEYLSRVNQIFDSATWL